MNRLCQISRKKKFAIQAAVFGSVGGFLFGYDSGVISGALPKLKEEFNLSVPQQETIVSLLVLGGCIGAVIGGFICDRMGRSKTFGVVTVIFVIGSIILGFASNISMLYFGRVIIGIAVSMSAVVDVTYLTEVSPTEYRGAVVSTNELMITVGLLASFVASYIFIDFSVGWRYMFLVPVPCAVIWGGCMMCMPESPRWLLVKGKGEDAIRVYRQIMGSEAGAEREYRAAVFEIEKSGSTSMRSLWTDWWLSSAVAILLAMLSQFSGNTGVLAYTPEILSRVGMSPRVSSMAAVVIGCVKVVMMAVCLPLIDRLGRRPLLLFGITGITVSLFTLALSSHMDVSPRSGPIALAALCTFTASYSLSYGPMCWLVSSELLPDELRGRALGMVSVANWGSSLVISASFLSSVQTLGLSSTFLIYSIFSCLSLVLVYIILPETLGRHAFATLSELHARLRIPLPAGVLSRMKPRMSREVDEAELSRQILMMTISPLPLPVDQTYNILPGQGDDLGITETGNEIGMPEQQEQEDEEEAEEEEVEVYNILRSQPVDILAMQIEGSADDLSGQVSATPTLSLHTSIDIDGGDF